ncbi:MAG: hypothetical protein NZ739_04945, partial [Verrucomicrobiae bacterium]|nr:hypothetical protein [Verrucomicrobiae bacterium]
NTLWSTNSGVATNGPYFYDVENRLTNATVNGLTVLLGYNGDGVRVRKTVGTTNIYYLVDDRNLTGYAQVLEEHVGVGSQPPTLARVYTYGLDLISQREVPSGTIYYFIYDGHGSTRALADGDGNIMGVVNTNGLLGARYHYDPYDNTLSAVGLLAEANL